MIEKQKDYLGNIFMVEVSCGLVWFGELSYGGVWCGKLRFGTAFGPEYGLVR